MTFSSFTIRKVAWPVLALALSCGGVIVACGDDDEPSPNGDAGSGGKGSGGKGSGGKGSGGKGSGGANTGGTDGGTGGSIPQEGGVPTTLTFGAVVGNRPFDCKSKYPGLGTSKAELAPVDFRFYVHDVRVIDADGDETAAALVPDGKWQTDRVALLDFENNEGTCENGTRDVRDHVELAALPNAIKGVVFRVGIPEDLNHANPVAAPSPLNLTALHWSWNFGYKFAKIDFKLVPGDGGMPMPEGGMHGDGGMVMPDGGGMNHGGLGAVLFHLGSVGCTTTDGGAPSCSIKSRPEIRFESFDPESQKIVFDYAKLVEKIDAAKDHGGAPGCMGDPADPECAHMFDAIGLSLTGEPKAEHPVFSVVDR